MGSELFLYGNPRYLSGGGRHCERINYSNKPATKDPGDAVVTTKWLETRLSGADRQSMALADIITHHACQAVHRGKAGYHSRPALNRFLERGQHPTVGVELEMEERTDVDLEELTTDLASNWFHFESDSSLHTGVRNGFELITEPLPPRAYRDPRLWAGLQNLLTPWFESYKFSQTGLHVHVGIDMFTYCDTLPFTSPKDRRMMGKYIAALVYYVLLPRSFVDKVMLRQNTTFCAQTGNSAIDQFRNQIYASAGATTGYDLINMVAEELLKQSITNWPYFVTEAAADRRSVEDVIGDTVPQVLLSSHLHGFTDHHVEVNTSPAYTIEFRRGKGTLHSLSIHRMVELASLVVRYAWRVVRDPSLAVSPDDVLEFIERATVNEALRRMARDARTN
jgi:hypothetical protein